MQSWSNKDILVISPAPAMPRNFGNRLRIHRMCERLTEAGARVHFLLYPSESDWRSQLPLDAMRAHQDRFASFHLVPPTRSLHNGAIGTHHRVDEWWDPAIGQYLDWLTRVQRFDAAIVNYTWLSRALLHLPDTCLKILDTHDRFSGRKELFITHGLAPEFFYLQPEEEAAALSRADVVWAIKREEAAFFRRLTDKPVVTVPHIDPVAELPAPAESPFLRVGIIGANNNLNRDNFERFLDAAVAQVRRALTQFELVVAGSVCRALRPRDEKFIRFMGVVERTEDFYNAIDVAVVPMTFSTGLKIKTAEALAFGKPVVALEHAFEGLNPIHALHRLTSFDEILAAVDRLARDPALLRDLALSSLVSAEASDRDVRAGLAETLTVAGPLGHPTFWLVVNAEEIAALPVLADHVREALSFLRHLFPSVGTVLAGPGKPDVEFCAQLASYGRILILEDGRDSIDLTGMPARVATASLGQLLPQTAGAWVTTRHGLEILASLPPGLGFAVLDALWLSFAGDPEASDATVVAALCRAGAGHVLCAQTLRFDGLEDLMAAGWDFLLLPWLKSGEQAELLARLRDAPRVADRLDWPAPTLAPGRRLLDSRLAAARALAGQASSGRALAYRFADADQPDFLVEYLLRIGAEVEIAGTPALGHEAIEAALRHDAGWSRIWTLGLALIERLAQTGSARAFVEPPAAPAAALEVAAGSPPVPDSPVRALPQRSDDPTPTLGFTRLTGTDVLNGDEAHFAQLRVYRPQGVGMDAIDVQFMNALFAARSLNRLILRFFFVDDQVNLSLRRRDCSPDAFLGPDETWQEDDWGPFSIYNLGQTLASAYPKALDAGDRAVLAEALNAVHKVQDLARPQLLGDILDRWNRIVLAIRACDLTAEPAPPAATDAAPAEEAPAPLPG